MATSLSAQGPHMSTQKKTPPYRNRKNIQFITKASLTGMPTKTSKQLLRLSDIGTRFIIGRDEHYFPEKKMMELYSLIFK